MRNRVAEFEGRGELVEATHRALTDQSLDLVVVRNIGEIVGKAWDGGNTSRNRDQLPQLVPEIIDAKEIVENWWQKNGVNLGWKMRDGLWSVFNREQLSNPHFDASSRIGVTYSARVDNNAGIKRYFYGIRLETPTLLVGEQDVSALTDWQIRHKHLDNSGPSVWARHMSNVEQEPGDWVIFPNHPYPAFHATSASDRQGKLDTSTRALIASYAAYSIAPSSIPNVPTQKVTIKV